MRSSIEAEQALLGAVLSDPAGQHRVIDLVEPGDMGRPWHGQVLAAMQRLRGCGLLPSAASVYQELQNDPDLPRSVALDAVPLIGLMEAAPRPAHAAAYAAIVVEAGIRRRLQLAGSRIMQAAESSDLEAALSQAAHARRDLDASAARWTALPEPLRADPPNPARAVPRDPLREGTALLDGDVKTGNNDGSHDHAPAIPDQPRDTSSATATPGRRPAEDSASRARPSGPAARAASARALRNLIDDPGQLAVVHRWLRPEHFAPAQNGLLYALLQDMHKAGKPVDAVTVAWEAGRRDLQADPARLAGGIGPFAVWDAREVYRLGVLAQLALAGTGIQADAADPACAPRQLIHSARNRLQPFHGQPHPVGFQNSATRLDPGFYAARSYSLMRPLRTGRRLIRWQERSAIG